MKNKKLTAIVAAILVIVVAIGGFMYFKLRPQTSEGAKTIEFSVTDKTETKKFTIKTDAEFLSGALEEQKLIEGTESEYGLFVTKVNGIAADSSKEEWWCFTKGGEMLMTGVDSTPIADGDSFEATLKVGYDS
ncbi:MAG: DUF4430 domain-containing protein [Acutalibacteraceae bacterium]|nr:DUF4430 domain-containing protein [Oscillospiraceae bacterium]